MSSFLPNLSPDQLEKAQEEFQYDQEPTYVSPLAVAKSVPPSQKPAFCWLIKMASRALKIFFNHIAVQKEMKERNKHRKAGLGLARDIALGRIAPFKVIKYVEQQLEAATLDRRQVNSLEDYSDLFHAIGLPPIHKNFQDDVVFAYMRVAGPNPLLIKRVKDKKDLLEKMPVEEWRYSNYMSGDLKGSEDTLDRAISENRLYLADYAALDDAERGYYRTSTGEELPKFLYAPLSLYSVDLLSQRLMPIAIQCEQKPDKKNPVFYPSVKNYWEWMIAKTIVQVADGNYHETISHLGRTHLFVEPFVVSTYRQLPEKHPVHKLLTPHFTGTLSINDAAVHTLIAPGEQVAQVMAPKIESVWGLTLKGVMDYKVDENLLPQTFKDREVDDTEALPCYPYRDDSMQYWKAIHSWVSSYLAVYYGDGEIEDPYLQNWYGELKAPYPHGGNVQGMNGDTKSVSYLADVLTLVIFSSSVQHAAVNFPQYDLMSYVPNVPGACYHPRPEVIDPDKGQEEAAKERYLKTLPPLNIAETQTQFLYLLGSNHYTRLGKYPRWQFSDGRVKQHLKDFQNALEDINTNVKLANSAVNTRPGARVEPYKFLLPAGVPRSINV